MAVYISSFPSGNAWLSYITANFLPSNGWFAVKNSESEKILQIPAGGNIAMSVSGDELLLTAFEYQTLGLSVVEQSAFSGLPGLTLPSGPVDTWTILNERRLIAVLRSNGVYHSAYLGLIDAFGSTRTYPFPCFVGGSSGGSAFPYFGGGSQKCPKVCVPDGTWQLVGGEYGAGLSSFASFDYSKKCAYVFPFDGKNKRLGTDLDGGITLHRALVVSDKFERSVQFQNPNMYAEGVPYADDGQWLGYLDGVFACPATLTAGSVFEIEDVQYLVVRNLGVAGELFAVELA